MSAPSAGLAKLTLLLDAPGPADGVEQIRRAFPQIEILTALTADALRRAQVIFTSAAAFDHAAAPNLRFVQVDTAAVDRLMKHPLASSAIPVTNVRGAYSVGTAEFTIGLLLQLTRRLDRCQRLQVRQQWTLDPAADGLCGYSLYGKTMGVVGYGSIGRHVAHIARGLGMGILACKRDPQQHREEGFELPGVGDPEGTLPLAWFGMEQCAAMLQDCHVAVVTLPRTPQTLGLIGRKELAALGARGYLVNVGRGGIVVEAELDQALRNGVIAGAALDVQEQEPLPADSPLWTAPNLIITPHIASYTSDQQQRAWDVLLENLRRCLAGEELINRVDLARGY